MRLVAACAFGIEALVKRELIALGYEPHVVSPGRIAFEGDWEAVCRTNIHLRTADRVLVEALRFPAADFDALFETTAAFDWSRFIPADASFPVTGRSRKSQLTSVPAVQRAVKRAVVEGLKKFHGTGTLPETGPKYGLDIALLNDEATITIDTTGASLHKRGYRKLVGEAPIKETLAAAMIMLSVWNKDRPLIDPFCGSGTILTEAALIGLNVAPGVNREFASSSWLQISTQMWLDAKSEARAGELTDTELDIAGFDVDEEVLKLARKHVVAAGVEKHIHLQQRPFADLRSKKEYGCVITNPPYGDRLSERRALRPLYESIPGVLQRLPTWSHFIITSVTGFERTVGREATRRRKLFNGPIECTYFQYLGPRPPRKDEHASQVSPTGAAQGDTAATQKQKRKDETKPVFGGLEDKDREQAELFATRLKKRAKHLRRWPTRRGITCFRIYERDVPELPFVVDRYGEHLHITEYDRPHERDPARHAAWNELMVSTAASALEVPIQKTFFKSRLRKPGAAQYTKVAADKKLTEVEEAGLKFLINLSDYVDTGLFLDHRNTRAMVRDEAGGKRILNLFAYTGSFSVYAAAGGASSTTTVDWSNTYIEWAGKNMAANGFTGPEHHYYAEDVVRFVSEVAQSDRTFDLVIVDPPTYSNSKRSENDWDVQQHHSALLRTLAESVSVEGVVYFSNNFRRFKLDESLAELYDIREISKQTVPEDFRNKRIHRCWRMVKKLRT
ncbi:MAG: bifunctional 23S rRNA (guanine(2069)-N(7))-methyltransferase RlmK/23S rRNA (guanine(2445)-N(2))-methyltransferase RlmL [Planctomycetota bacterium]